MQSSYTWIHCIETRNRACLLFETNIIETAGGKLEVNKLFLVFPRSNNKTLSTIQLQPMTDQWKDYVHAHRAKVLKCFNFTFVEIRLSKLTLKAPIVGQASFSPYIRAVFKSVS